MPLESHKNGIVISRVYCISPQAKESSGALEETNTITLVRDRRNPPWEARNYFNDFVKIWMNYFSEDYALAWTSSKVSIILTIGLLFYDGASIRYCLHIHLHLLYNFRTGFPQRDIIWFSVPIHMAIYSAKPSVLASHVHFLSISISVWQDSRVTGVQLKLRTMVSMRELTVALPTPVMIQSSSSLILFDVFWTFSVTCYVYIPLPTWSWIPSFPHTVLILPLQMVVETSNSQCAPNLGLYFNVHRRTRKLIKRSISSFWAEEFMNHNKFRESCYETEASMGTSSTGTFLKLEMKQYNTTMAMKQLESTL
ncbi:uncharacterized protein BDR25DRAFT_360167 [Lindgomyces ingoldianus]|uniref:Uncharacterized protein n=1 Tax=Lindgomyces ingoldianus TaxID=673940 RepID=A0ACB6QGK7_9PLEO|nr:uncharacterized protein BDR25DRAFT_360167 [Lindgomyces ingoldianus]KAF2466022.1 hypothetical protein BDR25DRAFT_360167 [Lindgomyces ingoldianus]